MPSQVLIPKFLAPGVIKAPGYELLGLVVSNMTSLQAATQRRTDCHVVVLGPGMQVVSEAGPLEWPNYPLKPVVVYETSLGDKAAWPYKFDEIARCKAIQLWQDRNDGGSAIQPHLLFPGDAPYWGGVKRKGLVSVCSGFKEHVDRMIAGMLADLFIGLAYDAWVKSPDKRDDVCFLA